MTEPEIREVLEDRDEGCFGFCLADRGRTLPFFNPISMVPLGYTFISENIVLSSDSSNTIAVD